MDNNKWYTNWKILTPIILVILILLGLIIGLSVGLTKKDDNNLNENNFYVGTKGPDSKYLLKGNEGKEFRGIKNIEVLFDETVSTISNLDIFLELDRDKSDNILGFSIAIEASDIAFFGELSHVDASHIGEMYYEIWFVKILGENTNVLGINGFAKNVIYYDGDYFNIDYFEAIIEGSKIKGNDIYYAFEYGERGNDEGNYIELENNDEPYVRKYLETKYQISYESYDDGATINNLEYIVK